MNLNSVLTYCLGLQNIAVNVFVSKFEKRGHYRHTALIPAVLFLTDTTS